MPEEAKLLRGLKSGRKRRLGGITGSEAAAAAARAIELRLEPGKEGTK